MQFQQKPKHLDWSISTARLAFLYHNCMSNTLIAFELVFLFERHIWIWTANNPTIVAKHTCELQRGRDESTLQIWPWDPGNVTHSLGEDQHGVQLLAEQCVSVCGSDWEGCSVENGVVQGQGKGSTRTSRAVLAQAQAQAGQFSSKVYAEAGSGGEPAPYTHLRIWGSDTHRFRPWKMNKTKQSVN